MIFDLNIDFKPVLIIILIWYSRMNHLRLPWKPGNGDRQWGNPAGKASLSGRQKTDTEPVCRRK